MITYLYEIVLLRFYLYIQYYIFILFLYLYIQYYIIYIIHFSIRILLILQYLYKTTLFSMSNRMSNKAMNRLSELY